MKARASVKTKSGKEVTVGLGWVGRWLDGNIGWALPDYLTGYQYTTEKPDPQKDLIGDDRELTLCEITVRVLKDKNGKRITRKMKMFRK